MHASSLSVAVLFAGLAAATGGQIALSSFTPRIEDLPSKCKTVYNTPINGCVSSDFGAGATCSSGCLAGLAKIGSAVKIGCADVDVGETSMIGVFQNDIGVASLCPNNELPSSSSSSSSLCDGKCSSTGRGSSMADLQTTMDYGGASTAPVEAGRNN